MTEWTYNLITDNNPREREGALGLYLTLIAAEEAPSKYPTISGLSREEFEWSNTDTELTIRFRDEEVLNALLDGMGSNMSRGLYLLPLGKDNPLDPRTYQSVEAHNAFKLFFAGSKGGDRRTTAFTGGLAFPKCFQHFPPALQDKLGSKKELAWAKVKKPLPAGYSWRDVAFPDPSLSPHPLAYWIAKWEKEKVEVADVWEYSPLAQSTDLIEELSCLTRLGGGGNPEPFKVKVIPGFKADSLFGREYPRMKMRSNLSGAFHPQINLWNNQKVSTEASRVDGPKPRGRSKAKSDVEAKREIEIKDRDDRRKFILAFSPMNSLIYKYRPLGQTTRSLLAFSYISRSFEERLDLQYLYLGQNRYGDRSSLLELGMDAEAATFVIASELNLLDKGGEIQVETDRGGFPFWTKGAKTNPILDRFLEFVQANATPIGINAPLREMRSVRVGVKSLYDVLYSNLTKNRIWFQGLEPVTDSYYWGDIRLIETQLQAVITSFTDGVSGETARQINQMFWARTKKLKDKEEKIKLGYKAYFGAVSTSKGLLKALRKFMVDSKMSLTPEQLDYLQSLSPSQARDFIGCACMAYFPKQNS